MFNSVISSIIEGVNGADLKRKLLAAPTFQFNADKGDVVHSVQKIWKFELTMSCHMLLICSWFYSVISFVNCLQSGICVHEQIGHNVHDIDFLLMCSTCSETVRLGLLYPKDGSKKLVLCRITLCGINNNPLRQWCVPSITLCLCYNLASLSSTDSAAN